jgi:hypothetical protein
MTARASKIAQVHGNCLAQARVAAARRVAQQMSALLCEHLRSEPFPNSDGEFIDCRESGNQGHTGSGVQRSEIKLFPYALIWNCSCPAGNASSMHNSPVRFRFISRQKSFRERVRHKRSRPGLRAQIAFCVKL